MNCQETIVHTVEAGDSLYKIARMHGTTVEELYRLNPGINPQNLQIGMEIVVCVGEPAMPIPPMEPQPPVMPIPPMEPQPPVMPVPPMGPQPPVMPVPPMGPQPPVMPVPPMEPQPPVGCMESERWMSLQRRMSMAWFRHVMWAQMLLTSTAKNLPDRNAVLTKIMEIPLEIANIFAEYYPSESVNQLETLLREHTKITGDLMSALTYKNMALANQLNRRLFENANRIVGFLVALNPSYDRTQLQRMWYGHLQLITRMIVEYIAGNYTTSMDAFDMAQREVLQMADYLSEGIRMQFPNQF